MNQRILIDTISIVGLIMVGIGLWLYDPRLMFVIVGTLLLAGGIVGAVRYQQDEESEVSE